MKYLLDTNVVSALRVLGRNRSVEVSAASVPVGDQFVSAFTIATRRTHCSQLGVETERINVDHGLTGPNRVCAENVAYTNETAQWCPG